MEKRKSWDLHKNDVRTFMSFFFHEMTLVYLYMQYMHVELFKPMCSFVCMAMCGCVAMYACVWLRMIMNGYV